MRLQNPEEGVENVKQKESTNVNVQKTMFDYYYYYLHAYFFIRKCRKSEENVTDASVFLMVKNLWESDISYSGFENVASKIVI